MMTIAIMQPYLFPYIGYFQLIHAVDRFVIYDDVNFIKRGWIARNNILVNGKANLFTVPLESASQNNKINQIRIKKDIYQTWSSKFLKTLEQSYKKAPFYKDVAPIVVSLLTHKYDYIIDLARNSIASICEYLEMNTTIITTSILYNNHRLNAQDRIIDICNKEDADCYINAIGGQELYNKEAFSEQGIKLFFLKPKNATYLQFGNEFVPWLSIIDVLMFNSIEDIQKKLLPAYQLI